MRPPSSILQSGSGGVQSVSVLIFNRMDGSVALLVSTAPPEGARNDVMKATLLRLLTVVAAIGGLCGVAIAQQSQEVEVQATRAVKAKLVGRNTYQVPILDLSLAYRVNLADLDLSKAAGASEAERRVKVAAEQACRNIGRQYPHATPSDRKCAKAASEEAMTKVHELIAAAQSAGGHN